MQKQVLQLKIYLKEMGKNKELVHQIDTQQKEKPNNRIKSQQRTILTQRNKYTDKKKVDRTVQNK